MTKLAEMIVSENQMIEASYKKSIRSAQEDDDAIEALAGDLESDLEDDTVAA